MKKILLISLCILCCSKNYSQSKKVEGAIYDKSGCPIANVNISFEKEDTTFLTDTLGRAQIPYVYGSLIRIKKYGFYREEVKLNDTILNITLDRDSSINCIFDKANTKAEIVSDNLLRLFVCGKSYLAKNYNGKSSPIFIINGQEVTSYDWKRIPKNIGSENVIVLHDAKSDELKALVIMAEVDTKFIIKGTKLGKKIIIR